MDEQSEVVRRALGYPYAIPERSYVQVGGRTLAPGEAEVDLSGRIALLAYGANAAPEALARKLVGDPDPMPALRATLSGFDVVYSAHISRYGSVPATLRRSPGTEVDLFVTYPTEKQLRSISATEPNYELADLPAAACRLGDGRSLGTLSAYASRHGCLLVGNSAVALSKIAARRRVLPAMSEREVLEDVRNDQCPGRALSRFIEECVADPDLTRRYTKALSNRTARTPLR
jgi:hypothetical protein